MAKQAKETQFSRQPQQNRSRESMERLLSAATALLEENGYNEFTLQEASKRSKVSIGSIYNRFSGKDDLIREIQNRELDKIDVEASVIVNKLRRQQLPLVDLLPSIVKNFGNHLRDHSKILRPLMEAAAKDTVVASNGKKHFKTNMEDFQRLIMEQADEIQRPDPERATAVCLQIIYAPISRFLGLGTVDEVMGEGDWDTLLEDLGDVARHYLLSEKTFN